MTSTAADGLPVRPPATAPAIGTPTSDVASAAAGWDAPADAVGILLAGGGSGGTVLPGLAVAERLRGRCRLHVAASDRAVDRTVLDACGVPWTPIAARPPSVRPRPALRFARAWPQARRVARAMLRERSIDAVLSLGGFVAPPVVAEARAQGLPIVVLNLDAIPGRATRWLSRRDCIRLSAVPLPTTGDRRWRQAEVVGRPIRRAALAPAPPADCREALGLAPDRPTLLVTGASQGAATIDRLITQLVALAPASFSGWQVLHLVGDGDCDAVRAAYRAAGVPARVDRFLHEMGHAWGAADLAVSRAGAGSVAEAVANRIPTVFLPYPWHQDGHQTANAAFVVETGGAICVQDHVDPQANVDDAGREILRLMEDGAARQSMTASLQEHAGDVARAARTVADRLLDVAGATPRRERGPR